MSQSGKVLHLYVEVRPAPDQNGESKEGITQGLPVQDSPAELISQLASSRASEVHHQVEDSTQSQSPSPNAVQFQLQQAKSSPAGTRRWSSPVHSSSGRAGVPHTPPNRKRSVVTFSYVEKSNVKTVESSRSSACDRRAREERSSPSSFQKRLGDPAWFDSPGSSSSSSPKIAFRSPGNHQQKFSPGLRQPHLDPIGRAATQRAVEEFGSPLLRIKLAHALEHASSSSYNQKPRCQSWAGSPVQHQNISVNRKDHITDRSQTVHRVPQIPVSDQLSPQSGKPPHSSCAEPHSPVHWPGDYRVMAGSPGTKRHIQRSSSPRGAILQSGNNGVEGLNQLSESKSSSPAHGRDVACWLAEAASKASSAFTEAWTPSLHNASDKQISSSNSGESAPSAQQFKQMLKMNIPLNNQHTPETDSTDSHQPEDSKSHETNSHTEHDMHQQECFHKLQHHSSVLSAAQSSPALPSRVIRPSHPPTEISSPIRDPRLLQAELRAPNTPTLHRHQLPQYTGDTWSPNLDRRRDLSCFQRDDCSDLAHRLSVSQSVEEAPVSWTSRQQWGNRAKNNPKPGFESRTDHVPSQQSNERCRTLSPTAQHKRAEQRRREILLLGPVALDSAEEDEGCDEEGQDCEAEGFNTEQQPGSRRTAELPDVEQNGTMGGSSSRSSSGVTGSLGDRECVSPESSQSSHQSNETGAATSGIQVSTGTWSDTCFISYNTSQTF